MARGSELISLTNQAGSDLASHVKDARHSQGLLKCSGDSGFSSRMSEASTEERVERAAPLLAAEDGKVLRKRLTRISECQYGASHFVLAPTHSLT